MCTGSRVQPTSWVKPISKICGCLVPLHSSLSTGYQGDATSHARSERDRLLKQMREILSNRTYVKSIVNDLVATIG